MKTAKKFSQTTKLSAVFVAGLALATLGWWQADRLDLAFGSDAGINQVIEGAGSSDKYRGCDPSTGTRVTRTYNDNCEVVVSTESCAPRTEHVMVQRVKSGWVTGVSPVATKRTQSRIVYAPSRTSKINDIKTELAEVTKEIDNRKGVAVTQVKKDPLYQEILNRRLELQKVIRVNPKCIQPR